MYSELRAYLRYSKIRSMCIRRAESKYISALFGRVCTVDNMSSSPTMPSWTSSNLQLPLLCTSVRVASEFQPSSGTRHSGSVVPFHGQRASEHRDVRVPVLCRVVASFCLIHVSQCSENVYASLLTCVNAYKPFDFDHIVWERRDRYYKSRKLTKSRIPLCPRISPCCDLVQTLM